MEKIPGFMEFRQLLQANLSRRRTIQTAPEHTFAYVVLVGPSLLVELSCIRSIYRILKYEPKGIVRICWLLSAVLSFSLLSFRYWYIPACWLIWNMRFHLYCRNFRLRLCLSFCVASVKNRITIKSRIMKAATSDSLRTRKRVRSFCFFAAA